MLWKRHSCLRILVLTIVSNHEFTTFIWLKSQRNRMWNQWFADFHPKLKLEYSLHCKYTMYMRSVLSKYIYIIFRQFNTEFPATHTQLQNSLQKIQLESRTISLCYAEFRGVFAWHYHFCVNAQLNMHFIFHFTNRIRAHPHRIASIFRDYLV